MKVLSIFLLLLPFTTIAAEGSLNPFSFNLEGLKFSRDDSELVLQTDIMWDYDQFSGLHHDGASGQDNELRHTDITFKARYQRVWQVKLQFDIEQKEEERYALTARFSDAYLRYSGWKDLNLTMGQMKEPIGLDQLISSDALTLIERPMVINAFTPERNVGVNLAGEPNKATTWSLGVYRTRLTVDDTETHSYAVTGRATYAPILTATSLLHLGVAGSWRDLKGEEYKLKERAEVHTADKIVSGTKIEAETMRLWGLEAAWVYHAFSLQSEYLQMQLASDTEDNEDYAGYYLQASYFLTQEIRPYKDGVFDAIQPIHAGGALEAVVRYSVLDAIDNSNGSKAANITLGFNYYLNQRMRLMLNYIHTHLTEASPKKGMSEAQGNALSLRVQLGF